MKLNVTLLQRMLYGHYDTCLQLQLCNVCKHGTFMSHHLKKMP